MVWANLRDLVRAACAALLLSGASAAPQFNQLTLAADGAWTWFNDPRALFYNGALYFGCVRSDGASTLNVLELQTGTVRNLWASTWSQYDDHDNPGLLCLQDGRLLAIYARHGSAPTFSYRLSITTNPVVPAAWDAEQTLPSTGAGLTYANPYQLSAESGLVYDFCRDLNINPTVLTSSDAGVTWSTPRLLIKTGTGGIRPYVKYCSDYISRIDFLYTDGHPRDVTNSLYHAYYQGGALYRSDGTWLTNFSDIPLLHDSGQRGSVIYQYSDAPTADPNDHIPTGRAWCWEVVSPTNDRPVCVFSVQCDFVTGTNWSDDRIYYYYARWTGTTWQNRFIAHAGRPLYSSEDDYAGGIALDPEDAGVVYLSTDAANPFDQTTLTNVPLAPHYELYKGITADGGLSFTWTALTTNSAVDNLRPYVPRNRQGVPALLWFRGSYPTFTSFSTSVVGLFTNVFPRAGLIADWPLDASSRGATPDLALGNDLPLYGSPALVPGTISNAFAFNGAGQYLSLTHSPAGTNGLPFYQPGRACSVCLWVRGAAQTAHYLLTESSTTNNSPLFLLQTGQSAAANDRFDVLIRTTGGNTLVNHYVSTRPVFDGSWHHIAYVDDAGAVQVYTDGSADTNFTYTPSGSLALNATSVGALVRSNAAGFFDGAIDDVIVWGRKLSQAEVQSVMTNSIPALPPIAPFIIRQSGNLANGVYVGDNVGLFVEASGTAPLGYQWSKDGHSLSPTDNPGATNASLTLSNIQPSAAGNYLVVITNLAGAVTSSVIPVVVGTYTPVTNGLALGIDVDLSGYPNTQPGFQAFTLAANGATFSNAVSVSVCPIGSATLGERNRTTAPQVINAPPGLTQAQIYNDFVFAASTADGTGLNVLISRLAPNTTHGLTLWSFDPQSLGQRVSDWTETTSGTPVPIFTGYTFDGSNLPATDYDYAFGALLTSSANGQLQLQSLRHGGTSYGVFLNALRLVANPPLRITGAQWTAAGHVLLTVELQYPGQRVLFEFTPTLNTPTWQSVSSVADQTRGTTMTAEFLPLGQSIFYRASSQVP